MSRIATPAQTRTPGAPTSQVMQERIAQRAYEKWVQGGCRHGCDLQHWTEAEAELKAESGSTARPGTMTPGAAQRH